MASYGKRVIIVIITTLVVLAVLFTGQFLYQKYNVNQPLFKNYSKIKAVYDVKIDDAAGVDKIIIKLKPDANFKRAYVDIYTQTKEFYREKPFTLEFADTRTVQLENALNEVEPVIYQGIATGELVEMINEVKNNAANQDMVADIYLDNQRVYLVLRQKNNYLQEIISRETSSMSALGGENL